MICTIYPLFVRWYWFGGIQLIQSQIQSVQATSLHKLRTFFYFLYWIRLVIANKLIKRVRTDWLTARNYHLSHLTDKIRLTEKTSGLLEIDYWKRLFLEPFPSMNAELGHWHLLLPSMHVSPFHHIHEKRGTRSEKGRESTWKWETDPTSQHRRLLFFNRGSRSRDRLGKRQKCVHHAEKATQVWRLIWQTSSSYTTPARHIVGLYFLEYIERGERRTLCIEPAAEPAVALGSYCALFISPCLSLSLTG